MKPIPASVETTLELTITIPITVHFEWEKTDNGHPLPGSTGWNPQARYKEFYVPTNPRAVINGPAVGSAAIKRAEIVLKDLSEDDEFFTKALSSATPPE